jgi:predicted acyltransferase
MCDLGTPQLMVALFGNGALQLTLLWRAAMAASTSDASYRKVWLDVCRGVAVAGMILVNNPGSWTDVYWPLAHAGWHGWTPADLIFPLFLFIVGVSIVFALSRRIGAGEPTHRLYLVVLRRAAIIFVLGVLLAGVPAFDISTIRLTGVLQRIAICYLFASIIFLVTGWRGQALIAGALIAGYYGVLRFLPAPGHQPGCISKDCSIAAYIDRAILGRHIGSDGYDPEGLLSTIPALATTLCGVLAGQWLQSPGSARKRLLGIFGAGLCAVAAALIWNVWLPINKPLWTSTYVLLTAGTALLLLAFFYALAEAKMLGWWARPFQILGASALATFLLSELMTRIMTAPAWWNLPHADGRSGAHLQAFLYERLFISWAEPKSASILYAFAFLSIILFVFGLLYRSRIRLRL